MFDKNRFQAKYIEHGLSAVDIARIMGINPATLSRKVNGESDFTRNEIQLFRVELGLTAEEVADIFLPDLAFMQVKERRKEERDESMRHLFEPGKESLTIQREGLMEVMKLVMAWARASYTARAEVTGVETYEKTEVTLEALAGILLQDKKCRVVMHYDPATEKVYFEREDEPEATT